MGPALELSLSATRRGMTGKRVRRLRAQGRVPAVVYGHDVKPIPLDLDGHEFDRVYNSAGRTHLVDLAVDGGRPRKVLVREVQHHPRRHGPVHVDLYVVRMTEKLTAEVPVVVTGESPAVKASLGDVLVNSHQLRVECLPADIPDAIVVDITPLENVGDVLRVSDLTMPPNVAAIGDPEDVVVKIAAPVVAEPEPEVTEEGVAEPGVEAPEPEAAAQESPAAG